jgi:hypothetical protein
LSSLRFRVALLRAQVLPHFPVAPPPSSSKLWIDEGGVKFRRTAAPPVWVSAGPDAEPREATVGVDIVLRNGWRLHLGQNREYEFAVSWTAAAVAPPATTTAAAASAAVVESPPHRAAAALALVPVGEVPAPAPAPRTRRASQDSLLSHLLLWRQGVAREQGVRFAEGVVTTAALMRLCHANVASLEAVQALLPSPMAAKVTRLRAAARAAANELAVVGAPPPPPPITTARSALDTADPSPSPSPLPHPPPVGVAPSGKVADVWGGRWHPRPRHARGAWWTWGCRGATATHRPGGAAVATRSRAAQAGAYRCRVSALWCGERVGAVAGVGGGGGAGYVLLGALRGAPRAALPSPPCTPLVFGGCHSCSNCVDALVTQTARPERTGRLTCCHRGSCFECTLGCRRGLSTQPPSCPQVQPCCAAVVQCERMCTGRVGGWVSGWVQ